MTDAKAFAVSADIEADPTTKVPFLEACFERLDVPVRHLESMQVGTQRHIVTVDSNRNRTNEIVFIFAGVCFER